MKKQLLVSIAFMLVSSLGVFAQQTDFAIFLIRNAYVNGRFGKSHICMEYKTIDISEISLRMINIHNYSMK